MRCPAILLIAAVLAAPALAQVPSTDQEFIVLHDALHLSATPEAAWIAYRGAAPSPAATDQRRQAVSRMIPTLISPRRIDLIEAEMRQQLLELQRQTAALQTQYAALTPDQQRVFDEFTLPPEQRH